MSAINSKTGSTLTEDSTNEEIVNVINNIEVGTDITGATTTLLNTGWGANQSITIQDALSYKVFYGSFYYDTTGAYTIGVNGGRILVQKGYNNGANRYCSAVILPTSNTISLYAYGNFYVVGIK